MDAAYARLREHGVAHASTGPQRLPDWNPNAGGIQAFYFRDPDGHLLEILQFPPGKGDPRWQARRDALFLGIDHTAIVVDDTARALALLPRRARPGGRRAGARTHGVEQEHLNNVFGARLRITTLRSAEGPGVELLEYLAPRDGRPAPLDLRANDLAHWQTTIVAARARRRCSVDRSVAGWCRRTSWRWPAPLRLRARPALRDPDGHAMRVSRAGAYAA